MTPVLLTLYLISLCSAENAKDAKNYGRELKVRILLLEKPKKTNKL